MSIERCHLLHTTAIAVQEAQRGAGEAAIERQRLEGLVKMYQNEGGKWREKCEIAEQAVAHTRQSLAAVEEKLSVRDHDLRSVTNRLRDIEDQLREERERSEAVAGKVGPLLSCHDDLQRQVAFLRAALDDAQADTARVTAAMSRAREEYLCHVAELTSRQKVLEHDLIHCEKQNDNLQSTMIRLRDRAERTENDAEGRLAAVIEESRRLVEEKEREVGEGEDLAKATIRQLHSEMDQLHNENHKLHCDNHQLHCETDQLHCEMDQLHRDLTRYGIPISMSKSIFGTIDII